MWTALPNGYSADGKSLRLSLLLSPRLDPENDPEQLDTFPDFYSDSGDWTTTITKAAFQIYFTSGTSVTIAGDDLVGVNRVDDRLGTPDSKVWRALFTGKTFVRGFKFKDLSHNKVLSYSVAKMDDLLRNLYGTLAASASDQLPTPSQILGDPGWSALVDAVAGNDHRFGNEKTGLRDPHRQFDVFKDGGLSDRQGLASDLGVFELYHTPPATPKIDHYKVPPDDPRARAEWLGYKRTALPKPDDFQDMIDFHQIVAAMNQYPILLRKLGLVVDFLIDKGALGASANAPLWAEVKLPAGSSNVNRTDDTNPHTRTLLNSKRFQPVPRPIPAQDDYRVANGLLNLDPHQFTLVQQDADASGLKLMNFARTLAPLKSDPDKRLDPVSKQERPTGAPALRNAGLMLAQDNRGDSLRNNLTRQKQFNASAELIQNGAAVPPPDLYAEDLVRGYRIDIWDGTTQAWRSLCEREADYVLNSGQVVLNAVKEEGTVRLAATKTPDPASNPDLIWLHEALVSWTGWSLCAPPPGKTIHHRRDLSDKSKDHVDEVGDAEAQVPPGLRLATVFKSVKGSLPRLRYGRNYWIRARVVDLASNSLDPTPRDFGPENPTKNARAYFRYEPIAAPSVALYKPTPTTVEPPAEGESMERMTVRTFNDKPVDNTVLSTQKAHRFAVPARTSQKEAEYHGMMDRNGQVDPAFFAMLAAKDNSLAEEKIKTPGPEGGAPVEVGYAVMQDGQELPYLPDPLALEVAARLFNVPGFPSNHITPIPLYLTGKEWPDALPFKIELYEDPTDKPHYDEPTRTLFVPLPKAERATLRLSVQAPQHALPLLGIWNWLTPAQQNALEKMALSGQHWMLTPWRNIELVHAVQKPLITPEMSKLVIQRPFAATHAMPNFVATCSIKSTDHLDLLAQWNEPIEDVNAKTGKNRARTDHAFSIKITDEKSYAGGPDYTRIGTDLIRAGGVFQDKIGKKLHEFNDTRYRRIEYWLDATSQFREFMPPDILTEMVNGKPEPTDKNIKVTGPTARTWIPNSAPPPAPHVLYVMPTFGWVRSSNQGNQSSWRRGGGLRVYLNRPWNATGYGEMLAVVLPSANFAGDPSTEPPSQPLKDFVTQWGNDPIWKSPFVPGAAPKRSDFPLARTAPDPAGNWLPKFAPKEEADQPPGPFNVTTLQHPEQLNVNDLQTRVELAPHDVFYDEERQLWYSDIEVNWGASYYPFIRLALARYQPVSVGGAHLSNIVLADFMALVPDRWLNVTQTNDPRTRRVSVYGPTYNDSSSRLEAVRAPAAVLKLPDGTVVTMQAPDVAKASVVEVWVERLNPALGEDFGWQRDPGAIITPDLGPIIKQPPVADKRSLAQARTRARQLLRERKYDVLIAENLVDKIRITPTLWEGSVTLSQAPDRDTRYRLAIAEYEEYLVDDARPYDNIPTKKDRRLVFIEHVNLA
jgi:hypothetical protein